MNNLPKDHGVADRATVTFHTSPETKARLERLATVTRRSKSFLTNEAVEQYLAAEEEFVAAVHAGLADAEAGRVLSGDQLKQQLHDHIDQPASSSKRS